MRVLYVDCFSGISGDMTLGALLDLGLDETLFRKKLGCLGLQSEYSLNIAKQQKMGIVGTKVDVNLTEKNHHQHAHTHRNLHDIERIIKSGKLSDFVTNHSLSIFQRIAEAEAKVHQTTVEQVHFHEVGAIDAIVDIVGSCILVEMLHVDDIMASALHVGSGTVTCAHGVLPVPAPATIELLKNVPVYSGEVVGELVTPTGAAIITEFASHFGQMPAMRIDRIGYGLGTKDLSIPNCLRVCVGEIDAVMDSDNVLVIETNIDNMTGEQFGYVMEKLMEKGALDVYYTPIVMKKGRPAVKLSVICAVHLKEMFLDAILQETSSIGVRFYEMQRRKLPREVVLVETKYGAMRVKVSRDKNGTKVSPEYEDCMMAAKTSDEPIIKVQQDVLQASQGQIF